MLKLRTSDLLLIFPLGGAKTKKKPQTTFISPTAQLYLVRAEGQCHKPSLLHRTIIIIIITTIIGTVPTLPALRPGLNFVRVLHADTASVARLQSSSPSIFDISISIQTTRDTPASARCHPTQRSSIPVHCTLKLLVLACHSVFFFLETQVGYTQFSKLPGIKLGIPQHLTLVLTEPQSVQTLSIAKQQAPSYIARHRFASSQLHS